MSKKQASAQDLIRDRIAGFKDAIACSERHATGQAPILRAIVDGLTMADQIITDAVPSKRAVSPAQLVAFRKNATKARATKRSAVPPEVATEPANDIKVAPPAPPAPPSVLRSAPHPEPTPHPKPAPRPAPTFEPIRAQPAQSPSGTGGKKSPMQIEAEELFAKGSSARDVVTEMGVGLNTVSIWMAIWRNEQKKAAAR